MHVIACSSHSMDNEGGREDNAEAAREARKSTCDLRTHPASQCYRRWPSLFAGKTTLSRGFSHGARPGRAVPLAPTVSSFRVSPNCRERWAPVNRSGGLSAWHRRRLPSVLVVAGRRRGG